MSNVFKLLRFGELILQAIENLSRKITHMSESLQATIDQLIAAEVALKAEVKAVPAAIAAQIAAAIAAQTAAGVTPEQQAQLVSLHDSLVADTTELHADANPVVAPVDPAPPAEPAPAA